MAVNLVGTVGVEPARVLLESSFAQFQADRSVVGLARRVARNEELLAEYAAQLRCERGDFTEYLELRARLSDRESAAARVRSAERRQAARQSLSTLRAGDVIRVPAGRRSGVAVVLDPGVDDADGPRPTVLTADRKVRRLSLEQFPTPVQPLGRVRVPRSFNPRSPQSRRDLASSLHNVELVEEPRRRTAQPDEEIARLRTQLREHPCHGCPEREQHASWAARHDRLQRETLALQRRVEGRTNTIAQTFDRVCALLRELGYLAGERVTDAGGQLARLYNEADLLVAECLRRGLWDGLGPAELAACASAVVYEPRGDETGPAKTPRGQVRDRLDAMLRLWGELADAERVHRLSFLREPELGFVWPAYRWAAGHELAQVLDDNDMTPGDFVRWTRQLVDLLDQVADVAVDRPVGVAARAAVGALRRGVVAYSSVG
jgi:ATP-dependent RNA helicase HelY